MLTLAIVLQLNIQKPKLSLDHQPKPAVHQIEKKIEDPLPPKAETLELIKPAYPIIDSEGNAYAPGYCTYGIKMWRPEIPNHWGNANLWFDSANAVGWPTGLEPRVNAIGVQTWGVHVVLVLAVNGDGTIWIREMNYSELWDINERNVPANEYRYIY